MRQVRNGGTNNIKITLPLKNPHNSNALKFGVNCSAAPDKRSLNGLELTIYKKETYNRNHAYQCQCGSMARGCKSAYRQDG